MQKDDMRAILFALVVCVVVSLVLSATATSLRERQEFNKEIDRKKNVLRAFGLPVENSKGKSISSEKLCHWTSLRPDADPHGRQA